MPAAWDEFTADELAQALAESRGHAEGTLTLARDLAARLPGTQAALRAGAITRYKAEIIACAAALLDPAEVLAADQRITAWARQLKAAGLEGDMDVLRAQAYLDLLLGKDSRPRPDAADGPGGGHPAQSAEPSSAGPSSGEMPPAGFAGARVSASLVPGHRMRVSSLCPAGRRAGWPHR